MSPLISQTIFEPEPTKNPQVPRSLCPKPASTRVLTRVPARGTPDEIVRPQSPSAFQHYQQQAIAGISPFNHDECLVSENLQQMSAQEDKVRIPTFVHVRPLSSRLDYLSTNFHNMSQQIKDLSYTIHASIP
ncbi:hypothetical protein Tco_0005590 [Tanacetum coccineum]